MQATILLTTTQKKMIPGKDSFIHTFVPFLISFFSFLKTESFLLVPVKMWPIRVAIRGDLPERRCFVVSHFEFRSVFCCPIPSGSMNQSNIFSHKFRVFILCRCIFFFFTSPLSIYVKQPFRSINSFLEKLVTWPRDLGYAIFNCQQSCPAPF